MPDDHRATGKKFLSAALTLVFFPWQDCCKRWFYSLNPSLRKERWTEQEDEMLLEAYARLGPAWHDIAFMILGRKDDQCAKRYKEIIYPSAKSRLRQWSTDDK